jgi:hypothetical protein
MKIRGKEEKEKEGAFNTEEVRPKSCDVINTWATAPD